MMRSQQVPRAGDWPTYSYQPTVNKWSNQALCRACEHKHCTGSEHMFSIPEDVGSEDGSADLFCLPIWSIENCCRLFCLLIWSNKWDQIDWWSNSERDLLASINELDQLRWNHGNKSASQIKEHPQANQHDRPTPQALRENRIDSLPT